MSDYDEMLKRLQAYRKSLGLKQRQICKTVGVTQEQYSYLENGLVKLTDDNLKALYGIGLDLDYLITGKEYDYTAEDLDILLSEFEESHKDFVMKMIAEVIVEKWSRGSLRQDMPEEALKNVHLLSAALQSWDRFSMVEFVCEDSNFSQFDMMQKLGIGIKKYRALEKEERYPDAELLLNLYSMSGYPPAMFMNISDRRLLAIKTIWIMLKSKEKKDIIKVVKQLDKLV